MARHPWLLAFVILPCALARAEAPAPIAPTPDDAADAAPDPIPIDSIEPAAEPAIEADDSPDAAPPTVDQPSATADESGVTDDEPELGVTAHATSLAPASLLDALELGSERTFAVEPLRVIPRDRADAWLTLSPGLVRANHGGIWHASSLFLRGFNAGEGQSFAASVEGVPLNEPSIAHGHGYLDLGLIIPEAISAVRVSQGAFRPDQSDFSVAGSAEYTLGPERRGAFGALGIGSFHTYRLLAGWASPRDDAPRSRDESFFVVDALQGNGFGPNRAHDSVRGNARFVHSLGQERSIGVFLGSHIQRHDSAGIVRDDAQLLGTLPCASGRDAQFFCVVDPRQGGSAERHLLGVTYRDDALVATVHAAARNVRFREDFTGQLLDPRGDGADERYETITVGSTGTYTIPFPRQGLAIRIGWDARHDRGTTRMVRLRRDDGVPYQVVFDSHLALSRIGALAGAHVRHVFSGGASLEGEVSLRVEGFAATIEHRDRPTSDRDGVRLPYDVTDSFGIATQPRGFVTLALPGGFSVHAAAGVGARSNDAQALSDRERAPFTRVVTSELGFAYGGGARGHTEWRADTTFFHTFVKEDLVFDPVAVRNVPIGMTRRYGATASLTYDGSFDAAHHHGLVARASLSVTDARFVAEGRSPLAIDPGAAVPFVPRAASRIDVAYHGLFAEDRVRIDVGVGTTVVGREPLPLDTQGEGYGVVDAGVTVGYRMFDVIVGIENVADTRYRSIEFFNAADFGGDDGLASGNRLPTRLYAAGSPRTFMITLRIGTTP